MALTLVTGPTKEPLTLEQAKSQMRVENDADDALILDYIVAARQWVEGQTKRAILTQTWDYGIDGNWPFKFGTPRITLPLNPVASVTSITYVNGDSPNPTLATTDYSVAARTHGSYIVPAYGVDWPTVRDVPDAITVRFVAGVDSGWPTNLQRAIAMLVTHWYENREAISEITSMGRMQPMPYAVESLISPYRAGLPG